MDSGREYLYGPSPDAQRRRHRDQVGFPIRKSADQCLFSAPRGLSQSITSFIASCCQGIHQTPFLRLIRSRKGQPLSGKEVVISGTPDPSIRNPSHIPVPRTGVAGRGVVSVFLTWKDCKPMCRLPTALEGEPPGIRPVAGTGVPDRPSTCVSCFSFSERCQCVHNRTTGPPTSCRAGLWSGHGTDPPALPGRFPASSRGHPIAPASWIGGAYRGRTDDLLIANQALSQLS